MFTTDLEVIMKTYLDENENMKQKIKNSPHGISLIDPLYTVYSNGN